MAGMACIGACGALLDIDHVVFGDAAAGGAGGAVATGGTTATGGAAGTNGTGGTGIGGTAGAGDGGGAGGNAGAGGTGGTATGGGGGSATGGGGAGGYTGTCAMQYSHPNIHEICSMSATECVLRASSQQGATCKQICLAGGGECLAVHNDMPDGTCNVGQTLQCGVTGYMSLLCTCSNGCGGGTPCKLPLACQQGTCK